MAYLHVLEIRLAFTYIASTRVVYYEGGQWRMSRVAS